MNPLWLLFLGMAVVVGGILVLRLHPFLALLAGAFMVGSLTPADSIRQYALDTNMTEAAAERLSETPTSARIAERFGRTCGQIGILIAMAAIIGKCLLESGAADRIVRSALSLFGEKKAPLAFLSSGFVLGIPVFFDTVFYLLVPLGKAMGLRNRQKYGLYILSIIAGASMAHSLVPPTPGPLFVAAELNVDLGLMMIGGFLLGIFTCAGGYAFARWTTGRWTIPLRESSETALADLEAQSKRSDGELPPLWLSLLPILLPVVLIGGNAIAQTAAGPQPDAGMNALAILDRLGDKNVALIIAAIIALGTLVFQRRQELKALAPGVESALSSAGLIILITAAGGAFGGVLQQTGIGGTIDQLARSHQIGLLPLAFGVTALIRTAQGSATVAMITSVGVLAGLVDASTLSFHPLYIALAIGCGSKPIPWMNDSGFWIICRMSGMTERETLKTFSVMLSLMGVIGLAVLMIAARLFPLV